MYLSREGDLAAYEELRSGFTAAVSHELRTPLARLLTLLETATLPGEDVHRARRAGDERGRADHRADRRGAVPERARVGRAGRRARRRRRCGPCSRRRSTSSRSAPSAPGSSSASSAIPTIELAIRPRMLRVVARNLAENAIRYAGPGATFTLAVEREPDGAVVLLGPRRRRRRRGGRAPAALRALLPRGSRAGVARHRARPRDRQARRHPGRRHRRGARRARRGPRDPLHVSRAAVAVHRTFTTSSPSGSPARLGQPRETGDMTMRDDH